jgi:hypothetical protein
MRWFGVLLLVIAAACTDTSVVGVGGSTIATGLLRGTVVDAQMAPVDGAVVSLLGRLGLNCATETQPVVASPSPAMTETGGSFSV